MADTILKIEGEPAQPEPVTQTFLIRVQFVPGSDQPPVFDFVPDQGMTPLDCIAMCNQGITWSLEAIEIVKQHTPPEPNRAQRRAAQKGKPRIWTPGSVQ